jgi:biotin carboxylase
VQRTNGSRLGTVHVLDALIAYKPAWIVCEYQSSLKLLVETVRRYTDSPAPSEREAVQRLRCSLPAEAFHNLVASKSGLVRVAAAAGVRVPSSVIVPAAGLEALDGAARQRVLKHPLPVIIKSDHDGGGFGVTICKRERCLDRVLVKLARAGERAVLQQYIEGPTAIYEGVGLDGHLIGGYARAEIVTLGRRGPPCLSRTINEPQLEAAAAALCRALRCTGLLTIDFVVDKRTGLA